MKRTPDRLALLFTIAICVAFDCGLLGLAVWLAGSLGQGVFIFLVGGGPITFMVALQIYSSLKSRFSLSNYR